MTPIAPHITAFLRDHLVEQRGASEHTRDSYAYSFQLLFRFASQEIHRAPSDIGLEEIDAPLVTRFLEYLETTRKCAPSTRNVRLAAIKSFFRFLEYRESAALDQIRRVLAVPFKRTDSRLVLYLVTEEVQALLDAPDPRTRNGIRDRALLHVAVAAGLRVSEITGMRMSDLSLQPPSILVRGKGRKERVLPLWKETASALRAWLAVRGSPPVPEVFVSARGRELSRWGAAHILKKHVTTASEQCPSLRQKRVSPHVLRHTCAMIALRATKDIRKVSLWLGHSDMGTTEVYTRADPSEKLEAIEAITPPMLRRGRFRPPDKLLALLSGDSLWGEEGRKNRDQAALAAGNSP
jgi:integrase/recombinase XerD